MGVVVVDFSWGYETCQFWICFTQFDSRPFGKNLYLGVGFGLLLGRCICDLLYRWGEERTVSMGDPVRLVAVSSATGEITYENQIRTVIAFRPGDSCLLIRDERRTIRDGRLRIRDRPLSLGHSRDRCRKYGSQQRRVDAFLEYGLRRRQRKHHSLSCVHEGTRAASVSLSPRPVLGSSVPVR